MRGHGVISNIGDSTPYVYVRLNSSPDEIYVMDRSELMATTADRGGADRRGPVGSERAKPSSRVGELGSPNTIGQPESRTVTASRRPSRRSTRGGRRVASETPIASFVNGRLAELGMKQCDFCRKTGFDQGLLSRIQSSTSSNLSLESCLRLAIGCSVSPERIFELIGRPDFHLLIVTSYSSSDSMPLAPSALVMAGSR